MESSDNEININLDDVNINAEDEKTEFVLYEENVNRNKEEQIENSGSEIEMISDEEYLLECARFGDLEDLIQLFKEVPKIEVNYPDVKKNTALHMASANGHLQIVKLLFEDKQCDLNIQNYAGNTPLHWAAMNGQKEVAYYLAEKGADVLIKNNNGKFAAQEAFEKNFYDISEFLVEKEVALNKGDIVEGTVDKNNPDDYIDMNVDIENEQK